jgi:hypothetical protein
MSSRYYSLFEVLAVSDLLDDVDDDDSDVDDSDVDDDEEDSDFDSDRAFSL